MASEHPSSPQPTGKSRVNWVLLGFIAVAAFFLFTEHRAHLLGVLPFLILLACPLLHLFMHRGHGGHGSHRHDTPSRRGPNSGDTT
ncbi:MAG: DUF2933 domain-containing protein [Pseudomonadota bacterium]